MKNNVSLLQLFVATPGDVVSERVVIKDIVDEWNLAHGLDRNIFLQIRDWKTSTFPAAGKRPQDFINEQALDVSDILVAVFWKRFGTSTGIADSGTEEEIMRSMAQGRHVMLYFSDAGVDLDQLNEDQKSQYAQVMAFRQKCRAWAYYSAFGSIESFKSQFRGQLSFLVQNIIKTHLEKSTSLPPSGSSINIGGDNKGFVANNFKAKNVTLRVPKSSVDKALPDNILKKDRNRWNYIQYLARQYIEFRKQGIDYYGDRRPLQPWFIRKRIEQVFKSSTGMIPVEKFDDVVQFVKEYIDDTILGKNNRRKGARNYDSFEEFITLQMNAKSSKRKK